MYVSKEMKIVIILSVDNECVRFDVKGVQQFYLWLYSNTEHMNQHRYE